MTLIYAVLTMLAANADETGSLQRYGWNFADLDRASLYSCPENVKYSDFESRAVREFRKEKIAKHYRTVQSVTAKCLKNSRFVIVSIEVAHLMDRNLVYIFSEKGAVIGKFMSSVYGNKSWK